MLVSFKQKNMYSFFKDRKNIYLLVIFLIYAIIYCSISLVNHYNFRTSGWDLGLFNNAMYDYLHFQWNETTLLFPNYYFDNTLGDHFSLINIFFAPFYLIFGSYSLLIIQIAFIITGGLGIYKLILHISGNIYIAMLALIHFFSIWGIYSALAFDYHDNVIAAMIVPWFFYFLYKNKYWGTSIAAVLILICKENMALWLFFICIGSIILFIKDKKKILYLSFLSLFAIFYFIIVINHVIPSIAGGKNEFIHFRFSALGDSMGEALITIITRPFYSISLLFQNHLDKPVGDHIKTELHLVVLFSGGIVLLFRPQFLIMLLPIYGQKLFNDLYVRWGLNDQYSIEFVPILTFALFYFISKLNKEKIKYRLSVIFVCLCILTTAKTLDHRISKWYKKIHTQFYKKEHYKRDFDVAKVHQRIKQIPTNARVSAQSMLVPHLAFRDVVYHYPYIGDAEYIVLLPGSETYYPLSEQAYQNNLQKLKSSNQWVTIYDDEILIVLKRKNIVLNAAD